jgi:hypothetical protein
VNDVAGNYFKLKILYENEIFKKKKPSPGISTDRNLSIQIIKMGCNLDELSL